MADWVAGESTNFRPYEGLAKGMGREVLGRPLDSADFGVRSEVEGGEGAKREKRDGVGFVLLSDRPAGRGSRKVERRLGGSGRLWLLATGEGWNANVDPEPPFGVSGGEGVKGFCAWDPSGMIRRPVMESSWINRCARRGESVEAMVAMTDK